MDSFGALFVGAALLDERRDPRTDSRRRRAIPTTVYSQPLNCCSRGTPIISQSFAESSLTFLAVNEKPGPDPEVTEHEILREIRLSYSPVSTPKELAERTGISNTAVSRKLSSMLEKGWVESDKVGRSRVYWLTDEGRAQLDPRADRQ